MFFLALPLVGGIWAFAGFAGRSGEQRAESQLAGELRAAVQTYEDALASAGARATSVAARRDVQLALLRNDRAQLRQIAAGLPGVAFAPRSGGPLGTVVRPAARRSVQVVVGGRRVGRVLGVVPLDRALLARLAAVAALPAGERLVLRRDRPQTLTLGGTKYHVASTRLRDADRPIALLALTPSSRVQGAGSGLRDRVLIGGLVALGCLFLLVYFLAPVLAQGRLLRRQRDQAARVLSHLSEGVFLVDDRGTVRLWNGSAAAITGLAAHAVQGRPAAEVVPGWAQIQERVAVDDRGRPTTLPLEIAGTVLWLSVSGAQLTDGVVYAFRDLTEEHKLEQMRSDFVATVSHELRTPLASIHGAAVTLASRGGELGPIVHERLISIVVEQSERLAELVEQILLAAQLDSGGLRLDREGFDAASLARKVISSTRPRIPAGVTVSLAAPPPDDPAVALGDMERARHVLGNLLDNAIKYSPDGGKIDVIVAPEEDRLRFTVRDEGLGIPPAEQDRIFEKFYRLDAGMSRGVGGSGLGLYICRELVTRMEGRIWVSSEPGRGSSFSFELPRAAAPVPVYS
jgi:PAS domain S-box-containing protein